MILQSCDQRGTTSFPEAQLTSKSCQTPSTCCIFCLPAPLLQSCLSPCWCQAAIWLQAGSGQLCPCQGTGSQVSPKVLSLISLPSSAGSHFLTLPLSGEISSLPAHPSQAAAGWSCKEAAVRTIQCDFRLNVSCPSLVIIAGIRAH